MLSFAPAPLDQDARWVAPDDLQADRGWVLPAELEVGEQADGTKDFLLVRYAGDGSDARGGRFQLHLRSSTPPSDVTDALEAAGIVADPVSPTAIWWRLSLRTPLAVEGDPSRTSVWRQAARTSDAIVRTSVRLDPHETQLLRDGLDADAGAVSVEVIARLRGVAPPLLARARVQVPALREHLYGVLGDAEATRDSITAAMLSIPDPRSDYLSFEATEGGDELPLQETLVEELAARLLPRFFAVAESAVPESPATYTLRSEEDLPSLEMEWDLRTRRVEERDERLSWSVGAFLSGLTEEERESLFPVFSALSPFATVPIHVLNHLPLDPSFLKRVKVDLRYPGPGEIDERESLTFEPGSAVSARLLSVHPGSRPFSYSWKATLTLPPPGGRGWPVVVRREEVETDDPLLALTAEAVGLDFVRVEADAMIFEQVSAVRVVLERAPAEPQLDESIDVAPDGETAPSAEGDAVPDSPVADEPPEPPVEDGPDGDVGPEEAEDAPPVAEQVLGPELASAWVALDGVDPDTALVARIFASAPVGDGEEPPAEIELGVEPVLERSVRVAASDAEVLEADPVTIRLDPAVAGRFVLVSVSLKPAGASPGDSGRMFPLTAEAPIAWEAWRPDRFSPVRFQAQVLSVARKPDGSAASPVRSDWTLHDGPELLVSPPHPDHGGDA